MEALEHGDMKTWTWGYRHGDMDTSNGKRKPVDCP